jgi:hypothetical protein
VVFIAAVVLALVSGSCDSETSEKPIAQAPPTLLESLKVDPAGRAVVAKVNGTPVYGDCVKRQAEAHHLTREEALGECIDFELLAQAANQPQYIELPEVQEEGKQELVRAFIESEYPIRTAADIPESMIREYWDFVSPRRYNRPELRDIVFCRIPMPRGTAADSEESKKAGKFLTSIYQKLEKEEPIAKAELFTACYGDPESKERPYELAGIENLELKTFTPTPRSRYQEAFKTHIFDLKATQGSILPPLFTEHGWDLIVLTMVAPELSSTFEEAEEEMRKALFEEPVYADRRDALFESWFAPLAARHKVTRSFDNLPPAGPTLTTAAPPPSGAQP